jgi:hypothetical protein
MTLASNYNLWSVAGLVYDLAGAALICNAVFLTPAPDRTAISNAAVKSQDTLRRLSQQWLDTRVGAVLLVIGFFLQATGALGTPSLNTPAVFVLLGLAVFAVYYWLSKDLLADQMSSAVPDFTGEEAYKAEPIPALIVAPEPQIVTVVKEHVIEVVEPAAGDTIAPTANVKRA